MSAFARAIDISQSTLKDIVGGRFSKPGYDVLEKILSAETLFISPDWLMKGKGNMITQNVNQNNQYGDNVNTASGSVQITKNNDIDNKELERLRNENDRLKTELIEAKQMIIDLLTGKK